MCVCVCVTIASHSPAVVEDGQYFVVGQLPVLALADEGSERRRADLARTDVELGLGGGGVVEVHPAPDVAPLEVALRPHARRQLYSTTCIANNNNNNDRLTAFDPGQPG